MMKKLLLGVCALLGTAGMAQANVLTATNLTACSYDVSISGYGTTTLPPGTSTFVSLPGTNIDAIKVLYTSGGSVIAACSVGYGFLNANTLGQPTPPCLPPGGFFTASWAQGSQTANASLVIF